MAERVVISGGSGGIGSALCRVLADEGLIPVVGYASGRDRAEAVAKETGGEVIALDLTRPEQIGEAVSALASGTPVAGLVLAAAPAPSLARFGRLETEELLCNFQIQVLGPQRLLAAAVQRWFRPRKRGSVVGVLSAAMGENDSPAAMTSMGAYVIGKFGLKGVLAACAADYPWLAVTSVSPGFTDTAMLDVFDERFLEGLRAAGKIVEPEDVAKEIADRLLQGLQEQETTR